MAPAPAPRKRFDLGNPGAKEYLIVGGVALGAALLYFWYKKRQGTAAPSTSTDTGSTAPASPTGLNTAALLAWIHDHQSSTTTTVTATNPPPTPKPKKPRPKRRPDEPED